MKYAIRREFGILRHFYAPMNRPSYRAAKVVLALCPKHLRMKGFRVVKKKIYKGLRTELFLPPEPDAPVIFYLHGGGFVFRGAPHHRKLLRTYARGTGFAAMFVEYRLAFNTPYGTPLSDCVAAYRDLLASAKDYGLDARRIVLAGDSAGGYLALALMDACRREGLPLPAAMMLIYPVVDPMMRTQSMHDYVDTPIWNARCNARMWAVYGKGNAVYDPLASDLRGAPPTYIETAQYDCLRDEGKLLAERLRAAGAECTYEQSEGTMHGFDIRSKVPCVRRMLEKRIAFLNKATKEEAVEHRPRLEVVAALLRRGRTFLICKRPANKARALLWEFVGGKVEAGETRPEALMRECREELAIGISVGDVFTEVTHEYPDATVHLTLFSCTISEGEPQMLEHCDLKWITPEEIPHFEFCPADEEILRLIAHEG